MTSPTNNPNCSADYLNLFLNDIPMMDVRAAIEVKKGAFPMSENRPLLNDEQRHEIGIRYKEAGEDEAIALGLKLCTPEIRAERMQSWQNFCEMHPNGYLYCFRGGLRSRTTQAWLLEGGIDYPLVTGGYKAMRRFLIDEFEKNIQALRLVNLAGPTGSGKTRVLQNIRHNVDFEGLAHHRGSAFGRNKTDWQPTTIDWENAVSIAFLKHRHNFESQPLFVEDEGRMIGRVAMPDSLQAAMAKNELVVLDESLEHRLKITLEDYVSSPWVEYKNYYGATAEQEFSAYLLGSLERIRRRLGGERYATLLKSFEQALQKLFATDDSTGFVAGIETLLVDYYDPMYNYQLSKRDGKIIFRGNSADIIEWANSQ